MNEMARGERVAGGSRTRDATECRRVSVPAAHPRAVREPETGRKATGVIQSPRFRPGRRPSGRRLSDFPAWDVCSGTHRLGAVDDEDVGLLGLGGGSHCVSVCERLGELAP